MLETDRTDAGRATVTINDRLGILDPTNPASPYAGKIEPLVPAILQRRNPVTGTWHQRFRGFVDEWAYVFDPSQQVNRLTVTLVDLFEVLASVHMQLGEFGDAYPAGRPELHGYVWFDNATMKGRIEQVASQAHIGPDWLAVFTGNVELWAIPYSPGESAMTAVQDAADGEFPAVSNVYCERNGRLAAHGRYSRFDPAAVLASVTPGAWDYHSWRVGDGDAIATFHGTAQLREFGFSRSLGRLINHATVTPMFVQDATAPDGSRPPNEAELAAQVYKDATSIAKRGIRSETWENLLTKRGLVDSSSALVETKRMAQYFVQNYSPPHNRTAPIGIRSIHPNGSAWAERTWALLSEVEISDEIVLTVGSPGGGGFAAVAFYVEGVHETCRPATPTYDDVSMTLDISPRSLYDPARNPFPIPPP